MYAYTLTVVHPEPFPIIDVSGWMLCDVEPAGDDGKRWLVDPETERAWLFKPVTDHRR